MFVKDGLTPTPSAEQIACHAPKKILFNTGCAQGPCKTLLKLLTLLLHCADAHVPYDWSPAIVALQMFRVGQVVIILAPTEFTTMVCHHALSFAATLTSFLDEGRASPPVRDQSAGSAMKLISVFTELQY